MKSSKISELISRVYDNVEAVLWATLFAFVVYFVSFTIPNMRYIRAQNESSKKLPRKMHRIAKGSE